MDPPNCPWISKGGGAVAMIIFHFVGGLRAVFTMIFAMFSARLLERFYKAFTRLRMALVHGVYNAVQQAFTGFFPKFL